MFSRKRAILGLGLWAVMMPQEGWGQDDGDGESASTRTSSSADCQAPDQIPQAIYDEAERWLEQGNQQAEQFLFSDAAKSYEQALTHWNHPRLFFNLSRIYMALERPLDAYRAVVQALRCGPEALAEAPEAAKGAYQSAVALRDRLLAEELGAVVLVSEESGIQVATDDHAGRSLQQRHAELLMPKAHTLTVEKDGHVSRVQTVAPSRGQTLTYKVASNRTFPEWVPWTVLGIGSVLGGTGVGLYATRFEDHTTDGVFCVSGCSARRTHLPPNSTKSALGIGGMVVGGMVLLAGLGLLWWSPSPTLQLTPVDSSGPRIVPSISKDGAGLLGRFTF